MAVLPDNFLFREVRRATILTFLAARGKSTPRRQFERRGDVAPNGFEGPACRGTAWKGPQEGAGVRMSGVVEEIEDPIGRAMEDMAVLKANADKIRAALG